MQKVWSISGRSIAVFCPCACFDGLSKHAQSRAGCAGRYPEQAIFKITSGTSVAEQGYKNFFADQRLLTGAGSGIKQ